MRKAREWWVGYCDVTGNYFFSRSRLTKAHGYQEVFKVIEKSKYNEPKIISALKKNIKRKNKLGIGLMGLAELEKIINVDNVQPTTTETK